MTRRRSLLPVQDHSAPDADHDSEAEEALDLGEYREDDDVFEEEEWAEEEPAAGPRNTWMLPAAAFLAVALWTAFFVWANRAELTATSPARWAELVGDWSLPVLLVIGLWLLAMRNSRREANRFTHAARALAAESAQLETRLAVVNRELSLARDFIASQSRDLESLGRVATDRLSTNADRLQALIHDNGAQVDAIGTVSATALGNMEKLRDQLPVLANSARDMSNQIGNAGNTAHEQIGELVAGFERLNQFGEAAQAHVDTVGERINAALAEYDRETAELGDSVLQRFDELRAESERIRFEMRSAEGLALDGLRARSQALSNELAEQDSARRAAEEDSIAALRLRMRSLAGQGDNLFVALENRREEAAERWSAAIAGLEERLRIALDEVAQLDEAASLAARHRIAALSNESKALDERIARSVFAFDEDMNRRREDIAARENEALEGLEARVAGFDESLIARHEEHIARTETLAERGEALAARLADIDEEMRRVTDLGDTTREGLGDAADALAQRVAHSRASLEDSGSLIATLTDESVRLLELIRSGADLSRGALAESIGAAEARLSNVGNDAQQLHELVRDAEARGASLSAHVEQARERGTASLGDLAAMEERIAVVAQESEALAERTGNDLRDAIASLEAAAAHALTDVKGNSAETIAAIADEIARGSREKIVEAVRAETAQSIADLEDASARVSESGRDTAVQLRDQLARINELTGNLEQRVAVARERAEAQVDNDFTRRMALITEALNSSAIDIAKAFDNEVSDTQWANYLRGDRGIFTRRAVRLLDKGEARAIAEIYADDGEFRETVNRYIHDFESMLREVLSTRDGNAIAVTLLSSDMGKLYVALAQAIERLR